MDTKTIDNIVWWIPIKKLRNQVRNLILDIYSNIEKLNKDTYSLHNRTAFLEGHLSNDIIFRHSNIRDLYLRYIVNNSDFEHRKWFVVKEAYFYLGYVVNLDNPKTMNEKINWLKLYYNNPILNICEDKVLFKDYIKEKLGDGYTIPLLGSWDNINNIDFNSLPNQFVLKSNVGHGSRYMVIVKDKQSMNIEEIKFKICDYLNPIFNVSNSNFSLSLKNNKQQIVAEEYISEIENNIVDYKIFCSFGKIMFIYVNKDTINYRNNLTITYDENWDKLNLFRKEIAQLNPIEKPKYLKEMIQIAKELSKDFPIVRVDFYHLKEKLLLGELTFFPSSGHFGYIPLDIDLKLGDMIDLSKIPKEHLRKEYFSKK